MSRDFTANGVCLEHEWDTWGGDEPCPYCDLEILREALQLACFHIFQIAQAGPTTEEGWKDHFIEMAQAKPLTRDCSIGDKVFWQTLDGKRHDGILREWDSNVAIIKVGESQTSVEC